MSADESHEELIDRLAESFAERYRRGQRPSVDQYVERYPEIAADLREAISALVMLEEAGPGVVATAAHPADAPPTLMHLGEFRIVRQIARGGMGVVYEAEQESLGRRVALKVLSPQMLLDEKHRQRFRREAKAAAMLHHSNIVPVFAVGQQDGMHYYAMQFIHGQSLDEVLVELQRLATRDPDAAGVMSAEPSSAAAAPAASVASVAQSLLTGRFRASKTVGGADSAEPAPASNSQVRPAVGEPHPRAPDPDPNPDTATGHLSDTVTLSGSATLPGQSGAGDESGGKTSYWQSVARIGVQAAEALEYAHRHDILHRDVKPGNLLLDTAGVVWMTDFGLAKAEDQQNLTATGDIVGTLRYMAPEVFQHRSEERSDVYSLGLTLYELLALQPAFGETDRVRLLRQVMHGSPRRLRAINPDIPVDLALIVEKSIAREPSDRYCSAGELAADLRRFISDEPIRARRTSPIVRLSRWCRRNPAVASLSGAVAMLLLLGVVGLAWSNLAIRAEQDRTEEALVQAQQNFEEAQRQRDLAARNAQQAEQAAGLAQAEQQRAEATVQLALDALDGVYLQLAEEQLRELDELDERAEQFLEQILPLYERLADQEPSDNSAMQFAQAQAARRVGMIYTELRRTEAQRGEPPLRQAVKLLEDLVARHPEEVEYHRELARAYHSLGRLMMSLGWDQREPDRFDQAEQLARQAIAMLQRDLDEADIGQVRELSDTYGFLMLALMNGDADLKQAESVGRRRIALVEQVVGAPNTWWTAPHVLQTHLWLGRILAGLKREQEAELEIQRGIEYGEQLTSHQHMRADIVRELGHLLAARGQTDDAVAAFQRASGLLQEHVAQHPHTSWWPRLQLAVIQRELGDLAVEQQRFDEAKAAYREGLTIARALSAEYPGRQRTSDQIDLLEGQLIELLRRQNRLAEAEEELRQLIESLQRQVADQPGNLNRQRALAGHQDKLGQVLADLERFDDAEAAYRGAVEARREIVASVPENLDERRHLQHDWERLGNCRIRSGNLSGARSAYEECASIIRQLLQEHPEYLSGPHGWLREQPARLMGRLEAFEALTSQQRQAALESSSFDSWFKATGPRHAAAHVNYRVRIETPGTYRLYLRWDGHNPQSDSLHAAIVELLDGPGGDVADWYTLEPEQPPGDFNFATHPWQGNGTFEEQGPRRPATWTVPEPGEYTVRIFMREDGAAVDALILQRAELPPPSDDGPEESERTEQGVFLERDGRVVCEAEHFTSRNSQDRGASEPHQWRVIPDEHPGVVPHLNSRGSGYVQALPDVEHGSQNDGPGHWYSKGHHHFNQGQWEQAAAAYSTAVELRPNDYWARLAERRLAETFLKLGDSDGFDKVWESIVSRTPENADAWNRRGVAYAAAQRHEEAVAFFTKAIERDPDDSIAYYFLALIQVLVNDHEGYRNTCAAMLDHFAETNDTDTAHWVAWTCALAPQSLPDLSAPLQLAEQAVAKNPETETYQKTLGAILYRAGRFEEALETLSEVERLIQDAGGGDRSSPAYLHYFLAMSSQRLGRHDEARAWLDKAVQQTEQELGGDSDERPPNVAWNRRLTLELFRAETEQLIGIQRQKPDNRNRRR